MRSRQSPRCAADRTTRRSQLRLLSITGPVRCNRRERPKLRKLSEAVFAELKEVLEELYDLHQMRLVREIGLCFYNVQDR
jgi:hypothetical protein